MGLAELLCIQCWPRRHRPTLHSQRKALAYIRSEANAEQVRFDSPALQDTYDRT